MFHKNYFQFFGYYVAYSFRFALKKTENTKVLGLANKVGLLYCPFFDYDITDKQLIREEALDMMQLFCLNEMHIFKTQKGYHLISTSTVTLQEYKNMLALCSCDELYKRVSLSNGKKAWILRISAKKHGMPTYIETIKSYRDRRESRAHKIALRAIGVPKEQLPDYEDDINKPLFLATYTA